MKRNLELWTALTAIVVITLIYAMLITWLGVNSAAGGLLGHSLGIIGFLLMLLTEILYSLRKRATRSRWGRMAWWLRFHIFTGLVGPYLVLLHTTWKYNGVAGMVTWLTLLIVASGLIGRYIYTAVPRTLDGTIVEATDLQRQLATLESSLQDRLTDQPDLKALLANLSQPTGQGSMLILGRMWIEWRQRSRWRQVKRQLQAAGLSHSAEIEPLLQRQWLLRRQIVSLTAARQMLALWHSVHVPVGVSLFVLAFIHIGGALYFASFWQ
jgi:multisubunit Na+/H+ antiporter MnhB subunit